jgi:hypothetical protein
MTAQWYRACGVRLLRIVIVKVSTGSIGRRVFFCTDANLSVVQILEGYAGRWALCANVRETAGPFGISVEGETGRLAWPERRRA